MTLQAALLLWALKRAQKHEDGEIYINFEKHTASPVLDANQSSKPIKLWFCKNSIKSILQHLENSGYIQQTGFEYFQVLHYGWHTTQSFLTEVCNFLVKSILTPIVVSIITTLLTAWVSGLLK